MLLVPGHGGLLKVLLRFTLWLSSTTASADADEDIASDEAAEEADADVLDEVEEEAEASLADAGETDSVKSARTIASEWLKSSILKTTADSKE